MRSLRTEAICWLRFGKRMPIVCTEVGAWHADVLGISPTEVVEIEIKTSRSDLRADFKKTSKHSAYSNPEGISHLSIPNYFYYFVPEALGEYAVEYLGERFPKAGVAQLEDLGNRDGKNARVLKRAQKIHGDRPSRQTIETAIQRMSSELCGRHIAFDEMKDRVASALDGLGLGAAIFARDAAGRLDIEDKDSDLRQRALELAAAVDGLEFQTLSKEQQARWLEAAQRLVRLQYQEEGWINAALSK